MLYPYILSLLLGTYTFGDRKLATMNAIRWRTQLVKRYSLALTIVNSYTSGFHKDYVKVKTVLFSCYGV